MAFEMCIIPLRGEETEKDMRGGLEEDTDCHFKPSLLTGHCLSRLRIGSSIVRPNKKDPVR